MIPKPEPNDPDDVCVALETASALWGIGDHREALRWVRRAASTAEEAGDDLRAVRLARSAADLATEIAIEGGVEPTTSLAPGAPPSAEATPVPEVSPVAPVPHETPPSDPEGRAAPKGIHQASPRAEQSKSTSGAGAPASPSAAQASRRPQPATPDGSTGGSKRPSDPSDRPPARPSQRPSWAVPTSAKPAGRPPTPVTSAAARTPTRPPPAEQPREDVWNGLRVSVKVSARDPSLLVVRALPPNAKAPAGTHEALILVAESVADLFRGSPEKD